MEIMNQFPRSCKAQSPYYTMDICRYIGNSIHQSNQSGSLGSGNNSETTALLCDQLRLLWELKS